MVLVRKDEFDEMLTRGFIKQGDFAQTMKNHSKAKRKKKYVREDKYEKYLKWKASQDKKLK